MVDTNEMSCRSKNTSMLDIEDYIKTTYESLKRKIDIEEKEESKLEMKYKERKMARTSLTKMANDKVRKNLEMKEAHLQHEEKTKGDVLLQITLSAYEYKLARHMSTNWPRRRVEEKKEDENKVTKNGSNNVKEIYLRSFEPRLHHARKGREEFCKRSVRMTQHRATPKLRFLLKTLLNVGALYMTKRSLKVVRMM